MRLGRLIADYRFTNRLGVRDVAKHIGISSATLCRFENGGNCDGESLAKIMRWTWDKETELKRARD